MKRIESIKISESSVFVPEVIYEPQYTCPNCGELFDGHECENCHYIEKKKKWKQLLSW